MSNKDSKRKCVVCESKINVIMEHLGGAKYGRLEQMTSEEGVYFCTLESDIGRWFCNSCWEEITKEITK